MIIGLYVGYKGATIAQLVAVWLKKENTKTARKKPRKVSQNIVSQWYKVVRK